MRFPAEVSSRDSLTFTEIPAGTGSHAFFMSCFQLAHHRVHKRGWEPCPSVLFDPHKAVVKVEGGRDA